MESLASRERGARRNGIFSIFALFSVVALGLLAISVRNTKQVPARFVATSEELQGTDFDNVEEVADLLKSKVRATAGDQYLYARKTDRSRPS